MEDFNAEVGGSEVRVDILQIMQMDEQLFQNFAG